MYLDNRIKQSVVRIGKNEHSNAVMFLITYYGMNW